MNLFLIGKMLYSAFLLSLTNWYKESIWLKFADTQFLQATLGIQLLKARRIFVN